MGAVHAPEELVQALVRLNGRMADVLEAGDETRLLVQMYSSEESSSNSLISRSSSKKEVVDILQTL